MKSALRSGNANWVWVSSFSARVKWAAIVLLCATSSAAPVQDVAEEVQRTSEDLTEAGHSRASAEAREKEMRARVRRLLPESPEAGRLKTQIEESKHVIHEIAEREKQLRDRLQWLESLPEYRIPNAMKGDERKPTKENISGRWSSGPNLVGYTIQLEQLGETVSGRGFRWGCMGVFDTFDITGTYRGGTLSLAFLNAKGKQSEHTYQYYQERRRPRFRVLNSKHKEGIIPSHELR